MVVVLFSGRDVDKIESLVMFTAHNFVILDIRLDEKTRKHLHKCYSLYLFMTDIFTHLYIGQNMYIYRGAQFI